MMKSKAQLIINNEMMNMFNKIALCVLSVISMASVVHAETPAQTSADFTKAAVLEFMQSNNIPGVAVEVYVDGKPSAFYFGHANLEKKTPVTKNTIFEIGAVSKIMTSIMLTQQIDAAKMQFDDSITKYLKELSADYEDIALKNLATNTSGLPYKAPFAIKAQSEWQKNLKTWKPTTSADQEWIYSNFGYAVLGDAIEKASHKNLGDLYNTQVAKYMRMQPIGYSVSRKLKPFVAQGYDKNGSPVASQQSEVYAAANGIKASAEDMQHFLGAAIGMPGTPDKILYPMRMTQAAYIHLPDMSQGLGWQIHSLEPEHIAELLNVPDEINKGPIHIDEIVDSPKYDGDDMLDQSGATEGFSAYVALIPNKKTGIVILTNKYVSNGSIVNLGRRVLFKLAAIEQKVEAEAAPVQEENIAGN